MNLSKKFSYLPVLLSFCFAFLLTACEGFFTNNDVDEKIRAAIDYANAPYSTYVVSADSNAGTIIPSGQVNYKPTDIQIITFTLKPTHEFIRWNFSYKETSKSDGSITLTAADPNWWKDYITIKKETVSEPNNKGEIEYILEIQFTKATENLLIEPVCALKPEIKTFTPAYKLEGVSRESQISIEFNSTIDTNTIFFTQEEINAVSGISTVLKNDQQQIYGYDKDSKRYFKNIEILLGSANTNVNDCYGDFSYRADINTLFISAKKPVEIVGDVVEVKVHFTENITNTEGAKMSDVIKTFCVNKSTNKKAEIDFKYSDTTPVQHNQIDAFVDQEITFPYDPSLQFLYWRIEANTSASLDKITVYNDTDKESTMYFCANDIILQSEGVKITAVYKKRPSIVTNGFTPIEQNAGVDKDSDIKIVFDQAVNLDSFIAGYKIDCNGNNVKENFDTPVLDTSDATNKTIIIHAASDSTIDIDSGTKKITVTIPAGLYYSYTDESDGTVYQITAGEDIVRTYKINPDTKDKLYVNFVLPNNEMGSFNNPGRAYYNRGEKFSILFSEPAYGQSTYQKYQFIGWTISSSAASKIECVKLPSNSMLYEFTVKGGCEASSPVTITADVRERISIVSFTPADSTNGVPKDSDIEITFNKPLSLTNCKDLISISCNGQDVPDSFPKSSWTMTGNTLTIPADKSNRLSLNSTPKGRVQVTIDSNLTYTDTDGQIITFKESDRSKSYCINNSTIDYATLTISENSNEGTINYESKEQYSIGEELSFTFTPDDDYEFLYWQISNADVGSFTQQKEITTKLKIEAEGSATISAKCTPKLKINSFKIKKGTDDTLTTPVEETPYPKDSDIVIEFNESHLDKNNFDTSISITIDDSSVASSFKSASLSNSTVTYKANQNNRIQLTGEKTITVTVKNDLFYEYTDAVITTPKRIYMKDSEIKTYKINEDTIGKASVQVTNFNSSAGTIKNASTGQDFTTAVVDYSKDQTFTIDYNLNPGYQFVSWSITGVTDNITFSDVKETSLTISIQDSIDGPITIKPISYARPIIKKDNLIPNNTNPPTEVPKNTAIVIPFEQAIDDNTMDEIIVSYSGISGFDKSTYFTTTISSDNKTVTLEPKKMLPVNNDYETVTITIPHDQIYYTVSDGVSNGTKIYTADEDFTWSYRVNNNTTTNTKVRISTEDAVSRSTNIKINDVIQSSNTQKTVNVEESLNLEYPVSDGYKFAGWKIVSQNSSYTVTYSDTVNSSGYVKSGTIYVKNGSVDYFTLTIDSENSKKAVLTSIKSIDSNSNAYAFTVFAKDDLIPAVSSVSPGFLAIGVACDTKIEITFNKAVNKNTVTFGTNGSIQIVDAETETKHYESYFYSKVWNDNTVSFKPRYTIRNLLKDESDDKLLTVKILSNLIKDPDGTSLGSDSSWTYNINWSMETDPPEVSNMRLWKHEFNSLGEEQTEEYIELSANAFSSFARQTYALNHIHDTVYFDAEVSDADSGYKQLTIKETHYKTIAGSNSNMVADNPVKYTDTSFNKIKYTLKSEYDGVVRLDFIFEDQAGNNNTKTFYVIKDTDLDGTTVIKPKMLEFLGPFANISFSGAFMAESNDEYYNASGQSGFSGGSSNGQYKAISAASKENLAKITPNSSHNVTTTLDFSACGDKYYTSYSTVPTYEVVYGTTAGSYTSTATKVTDTKFTITRDARKDLFIKITAYDSAGNSKTLERAIPRQIAITDLIPFKANNGTVYNYRLTYSITNTDTLSYLAQTTSAREASFFCLFKYKETASSAFSDPYNLQTGTDVMRYGSPGSYGDNKSTTEVYNFRLYNDTYTDDELTPNGIYYMYVVPYIVYPDGVYFGAISETPYLYYHGVTPSGSSATPTLGSFTVNVADAVQSQGIRNVNVAYSGTQTSGFTYGIRYNKKNSTEYLYTTDFDFSVASGYEYDLYLYARNNTTGTISVGTTKQTIDATHDNVPPKIEYTSQTLVSVPNMICLNDKALPKDVGVGMTQNDQGLNTFNYYIIKKTDEKSMNHDTFTKADLEGLTPKIATFETGKVCQIPFDKFIEGYYLLIMDLVDKNNNEAIYTFTICNYMDYQIVKTVMSSTQASFSMPKSNQYISTGGSANFSHGYAYTLNEDGIWKGSNYNDAEGNLQQTNQFTSSSSKSFMKIMKTSKANNNVSLWKTSCLDFFSTDYMIKKIQGNAPVCDSKGMIDGYSNTLQIFYDAPCFVHTMAMPTGLVAGLDSKIRIIRSYNTDAFWTYDEVAARVWATKGQEFNCRLLNGDSYESASKTYTIPLSEIPSGYSYVVIAHFADGSTIMTDVRQK